MVWMRLACGYPAVSAPYVKRLFCPPLNGLGTITENQQTMDVWVYFWILSSVPLTDISTLISENTLDFCSSAVSLEIRKCKSSTFVLFQDCLSFLGSFASPYVNSGSPYSFPLQHLLSADFLMTAVLTPTRCCFTVEWCWGSAGRVHRWGAPVACG